MGRKQLLGMLLLLMLAVLIDLGWQQANGASISQPSPYSAGQAVLSEQVDETMDKATVLIGGDVMLSRSVGDQIVWNGFDPFAQVSAELRSADLAVVNLECVISDQGYPAWKPYTFRAPPLAINTLLNAGIDLVSLANNHVGDYGMNAFLDMITRLESGGVDYFGGGQNAEVAYGAKIARLPAGVRIAFLGVSNIETPYFAAGESQPGLAWLNEERLFQEINDARSKADVVVVMPHWGTEYTDQVTAEQQRLGREMIAAGADVVIGAHPHHIQYAEQYAAGWIKYSVGNFVFDTYGPNIGWSQGEIAQLNLVLSGTEWKVESLEMLPIYMSPLGAVSWRSMPREQ